MASKHWALAKQHSSTAAGRTLVVSPNGALLVTQDGANINVLSRSTGETIVTLSGEHDAFTAFRLTPAGPPESDQLCLIAGRQSGRLGLWTLQDSTDAPHSANELAEIPQPRSWTAHANPITAVGICAGLCVSAATNAEIRVWNTATLTCVATLRGHELPVTHLQFSPSPPVDTQILVSCSVDTTVRVWTVPSPAAGAAGAAGAAPVATSSDAAATRKSHRGRPKRRMDAGQRDPASAPAAAAATTCVVLRKHLGVPTRALFSPDGQVMVTVGRDQAMEVWNPQDSWSHVSTKLAGEPLEAAVSLPASCSRALAASAAWLVGGSRSTPRVFCLRGAKIHAVPSRLNGRAFAPLAGSDHTLMDMSVCHGSQLADDRRPAQLQLFAFTSDFDIHEFGVVFPDASGAAAPSGGKQPTPVAAFTPRNLFAGHNDEILDVAFLSKSAKRVVVATDSPDVRVFRLDRFSCATLKGHTDSVLSVAVHSSGRWVATASRDHTIRVFYIPPEIENSGLPATGLAEQEPAGQQPPPYARDAGFCVAIAEGHTAGVGAVAFSRSSSKSRAGGGSGSGTDMFVVSGASDKTVKLWDLRALSLRVAEFDAAARREQAAAAAAPALLHLAPLSTVHGHTKDINSVAVSPDGSIVASGGQDRVVKLWSIKQEHQLEALASLEGHRRGVWHVAFSPTDRMLASCSSDATIRLWSANPGNALGSCIAILQGHTHPVLRLAWLPSGAQLLSVCAGSVMKLWSVASSSCETSVGGDGAEEQQQLPEPQSERALPPARGHFDRIWALALSSDGQLAVSGGADSRMCVWKDTTAEVVEQQRIEQNVRVETAQRLSNLVHEGDFVTALIVALDLHFPRRVLQVVSVLIADCSEGEDEERKVGGGGNGGGGNGGGGALDQRRLAACVRDLPMRSVQQLFLLMREWNTNARHAVLVSRLTSALCQAFSIEALASLPQAREVAASLAAYSERHLARLDALVQAVHIVDLPPAETLLASKN